MVPPYFSSNNPVDLLAHIACLRYNQRKHGISGTEDVGKLMRYWNFAIVFLIVSLLISGCSDSEPSSPDRVVKDYLRAMHNNDIDEICKYWSDEAMCKEAMEHPLMSEFSFQIDDVETITDFKDDGTCIVYIGFYLQANSENLRLKTDGYEVAELLKEDDEWHIDRFWNLEKRIESLTDQIDMRKPIEARLLNRELDGNLSGLITEFELYIEELQTKLEDCLHPIPE